MMELDDSSGELRDSKAETRAVLGIDLNEIPSSSCVEAGQAVPEACAVVRSFHGKLAPAVGNAAGLPGEGRGSECAVCGAPEVGAQVVVCDGCERGFHLLCVGMRGQQAGIPDEWVCSECVKSGVGSKRWPLGFKRRQGVRLLDINASPPSEGEGEELQDSRKHTPGGNSFGGNSFGAPETYSNFWHAGNGFGCEKASGILTHPVKLGFEDILHHTHRSFEEVDLGFPLGKCRSSSNTAFRLPPQSQSEMFLQALKEFISERHGVLEEGWHVELKQSVRTCELYPVYYAPDGSKFESMSEVAVYLGLMSNSNSLGSDGSASLKKRLHLPRRRKSTRLSIANSFAENKEVLLSGCHKGISSDVESAEISNLGNNVKVTEAAPEENGGTGSQQHNAGLPVQFEDFFVLSLGEVDVRPSYHDVSQLWPVGYKSCWHDKLTGSLFVCDVSDGGDSGPIFKVKRCACSAFPIPNGSIILRRPNIGQSDAQNKEKSNDVVSFNMGDDEDGSLLTLLVDHSPPMENDIFSCIGNGFNGSCYDQASNSLILEENSLNENSGKILSDDSGWKDEIGEFSLQGRSSSSVWRMVSQKIIDACNKIYKQTGSIKFFCKHVEHGSCAPHCDFMDESSKVSHASLAKFSSSLGSVCMPSVLQDDSEFQTSCEVLAKWLDQDRFGLDVEFVQEIIEQLPNVCYCSQYNFLNSRDYYATLPTVGNGLLLAETKDGLQSAGEEALDGLFGGSKRAKKYIVGNTLKDDNCLPPGNPLGSRLPPELVGDVIQVWESLARFHEILGLKEPFSIEELEEELICPWLDGLNLQENFETEIQENQDVSSSRPEHTSGHHSSSSTDSGPEISMGNPHTFIQMETGSKKEVGQTRLASVTYSRCSGVTLTNAHNSLLKVLVSELQFKVAALVDPNFESGESKSRRGRKKDADNAIPMKRTKLNMLPINELTWPELARRYILSVLSMDGNLDSAEITARESGKVFRCLQGDGGVLCGSLTGVAGMEADALLFAEARKQIFGSLDRENDILTIEEKGSDAATNHHGNVTSDGNIPEWAQVLGPVRKLPTNVGTRIKRCIYDALSKGPPEWARKILEHSISKEVYKGNASGPTKKAVLSVLGIVHNEVVQKKPDKEKKRKRVISISDIIMKQCRIVLRHAAAADDTKVFCTLLGSKLVNVSDNDDEGLLGTPAMVSRPLDFRTIDLRLAVGAYGGSWETFLEDARELWNNILIAYADQPNLVELASTLSQNFESLFEKEVLTLVQKFMEYAKLECLSTETEKEIDDLIISVSEIPKAPWDDGVCKVCGIDKDDDSVLLCDRCDAEYHTYCLNPPLAKIPEGNWYCPSCVAGIRKFDSSEHNHLIAHHEGKNYQGEFTQAYMESLAHLAVVMEEKEYWELIVDQRTLLLKFLCDELLNTALIRQHLEQCAEASVELQQKLRSISVEWKNLKVKEEILTVSASKVDSGGLYAFGEVGTEGGLATALTNNGKCIEQLHSLSEGAKYFGSFSDDQPQVDSGCDEGRPIGFDKHLSNNCAEENCTLKPIDTECQLKDADAVGVKTQVSRDIFPHMVSRGNGSSCRPNELSLPNPLQQEMDGLGTEFSLQGNMCENMERNDLQGLHLPSEIRSDQVAEHLPHMPLNESQAENSKLNSIKDEISHLQDSMVSIESELQKLSVRREFLGSDSAGRLYWVLAKPGRHPWVIVDGSVALQQKGKITDHRNPVKESLVLQNAPSPGMDILSTFEGSSASCPFLYKPNACIPVCSQWISYQSDEEIEALVEWLKNTDPRERELKESIFHLQKLRFQHSNLTRGPDQDDSQTSVSRFTNSETIASSDCLVTKAGSLLEKKYGPCFEPKIAENSKNGSQKSKVATEDKMYRCECLEPIWPSRHHCLSCHRTFVTDVQLEDHNDGRCNSGPPTSEKTKENNSHLKGKGIMKAKASQEESTGDIDVIETPKSDCSHLRSRLIKFQNEVLVCPYDFEEISSKFVTKDSNKELVQEIGLIGSKGVPSFVSVPLHLGDAKLLLVPSKKDVDVPGCEFTATGDMVLSQGHGITAAGSGSMSDNFPGDPATNESIATSKTDKRGCLEQKDKKSSLNTHGPETEVGHCCIIPQSSLRPLVGKTYQILRQLKISLLDMDAALPEEALRPARVNLQKRWAWRAFVKSANTIFEMVQATIMLEDMIKAEYLMSGWWYWSSLSAAAKTSTLSSLALRIYSLDADIAYEKISPILDLTDNPKPSSKPCQKPVPNLDTMEKSKPGRKQNKRRKESEG